MDASIALTSQFLALLEVIQKLYEGMLEKTGMSRLRWGILYLAAERGPLAMSDLTRLLDIAKSNVTYHVDWLEANGFLQREPSAEDRRVTLLVVTPEGAAVVKRVPDELRRRMAHLAAHVSPAELTIMEAGLKLLLERSPLLLEAGAALAASPAPAEGG